VLIHNQGIFAKCLNNISDVLQVNT